MIKFACVSPHPPLLLPGVVSDSERNKVKKTIESLEKLGKKIRSIRPNVIVVSSPHPDWGFKVPLYFLGRDLKAGLKTVLTDARSPKEHFEDGKSFHQNELKELDLKIALIASGDLSHRLKVDGPYEFHEHGPEFDKNLINSLKTKDIKNILELEDLYPEADECGLRSFCFLLGIIEAAKINWRFKVLSYQGPFGVGYLVADFELETS